MCNARSGGWKSSAGCRSKPVEGGLPRRCTGSGLGRKRRALHPFSPGRKRRVIRPPRLSEKKRVIHPPKARKRRVIQPRVIRHKRRVIYPEKAGALPPKGRVIHPPGIYQEQTMNRLTPLAHRLRRARAGTRLPTCSVIRRPAARAAKLLEWGTSRRSGAPTRSAAARRMRSRPGKCSPRTTRWLTGFWTPCSRHARRRTGASRMGSSSRIRRPGCAGGAGRMSWPWISTHCRPVTAKASGSTEPSRR